MLNYQNSFKILPNLGISLHQTGRGCIGGPSDGVWCLWCPDSCPGVHTKAWGPFGLDGRRCPALMQMWEPRSAHVSRILAWGILDQDNTSCLVQGIPALLRTLTWCHWDPCMQSTHLCIYLPVCWLIMHLVCYGNPCVLRPIVIV